MEPSGPRSDRPVLWTVTGSDGSDSFSLKRRRPASFFFFPLNGVVLNSSNIFFFTLLYGVVLPLSKSLFWNLISHFSITLLKPQNHSSLPLSNPHTLKSQSLPRAVTPSQLILSPSRRRTSHFVAQSLSRRTSQLSLSPASPSQRSLDRSVVVAVAAQPRY